VCKSRTNLQHHKEPFAHDVPFCGDLLSAIKQLQPTALVGVSTIAKAFNKDVVDAMCELNDRPIVFPLSNPTSKSECSFEEAFR
jgi:malate dehydrogenase (oxaloacetate-decarboxylating)(NADP+)